MNRINFLLIALSLSLLCGRLPVAAQVGVRAPTGSANTNNVPAINNGLTSSAGVSANQQNYHPIEGALSTPSLAPVLFVSPAAAPSHVSPNASNVQSAVITDNLNEVTPTVGTHSAAKHVLGLKRARAANDSPMTQLSEKAKHTIEEGTADWTKPGPEAVTGQTSEGSAGLARPTAHNATLNGTGTPVPAANSAAQQKRISPGVIIFGGLLIGFSSMFLMGSWFHGLPVIAALFSIPLAVLGTMAAYGPRRKHGVHHRPRYGWL